MARIIGPRLKSGKSEALGCTIVNATNGCYLRENVDFKRGPNFENFLAGGARMRLASKIGSQVNMLADFYVGEKKSKTFYKTLTSRSCSRYAADQLSVLKVFAGHDAHADRKFDTQLRNPEIDVVQLEDKLRVSCVITEHPTPIRNLKNYRIIMFVQWWQEGGYLTCGRSVSPFQHVDEAVPGKMVFDFDRPTDAVDFLLISACTFSASDSDSEREQETVLKLREAGSFRDFPTKQNLNTMDNKKKKGRKR